MSKFVSESVSAPAALDLLSQESTESTCFFLSSRNRLESDGKKLFREESGPQRSKTAALHFALFTPFSSTGWNGPHAAAETQTSCSEIQLQKFKMHNFV